MLARWAFQEQWALTEESWTSGIECAKEWAAGVREESLEGLVDREESLVEIVPGVDSKVYWEIEWDWINLIIL